MSRITWFFENSNLSKLMGSIIPRETAPYSSVYCKGAVLTLLIIIALTSDNERSTFKYIHFHVGLLSNFLDTLPFSDEHTSTTRRLRAFSPHPPKSGNMMGESGYIMYNGPTTCRLYHSCTRLFKHIWIIGNNINAFLKS